MGQHNGEQYETQRSDGNTVRWHLLGRVRSQQTRGIEQASVRERGCTA